MGKIKKHGVDISEHQSESYTPKGNDFVMIRASWGHFAEDNKFKKHVAKCDALNIPWGTYHYSYEKSYEEAKKAAENHLALIKSVNQSNRKYPIAIDIEDADGWKKANGITFSDEIEVIKAWKDVIEGAGEYLILYCSRYWYDILRGLNKKLIDSIDLWLAHWGISEPSVKCQMWQYTDTPMDKNYVYVDYPAIISKMKGKTDVKPQSNKKPNQPTNKQPAKSDKETINAYTIINNVNLYASADSKASVAKVSGKYWAWDNKVIDDKIRITNKKENVGKFGQVTGWIYLKDYKNLKQDGKGLKVGDLVQVIEPIQFDNGKPFKVWHPTYVVYEIVGNRVVIGNDNVVHAAIDKKYLIKK